MKFYNKNTSKQDEKQSSENRKTKKFMPTYTVGSTLRDDPAITNDPLGELIHASKRMHEDNPVSKLFAPLNAQELKTLNHIKNYEKK